MVANGKLPEKPEQSPKTNNTELNRRKLSGRIEQLPDHTANENTVSEIRQLGEEQMKITYSILPTNLFQKHIKICGSII